MKQYLKYVLVYSSNALHNLIYLSFFQGLKLKKQRSTGDLDRKGVTSIRSTGSTTSWMSSESGFTTGASVMSEGSNQSFAIEVGLMYKYFYLDSKYFHSSEKKS